MAALLALQKTAQSLDELLRFVQLGRDPRAGPGVCSVTGAGAPGCLLVGAPQAVGKHLRDPTFGPTVAPEFVPKRHSELSGNRGRRLDNVVRPEIGYLWVPGLGAARVPL